MARQMYNFFPTDFFFPPPQKTVARDHSNLMVKTLTNNHETEEIAQVKQLKTIVSSNPSSSLALVPIGKKKPDTHE